MPIADPQARKSLENSLEFQQLPARMQGWILDSSNASAGFLAFFDKGGTVKTGVDVKLPYYHATQPPSIVVSESVYKALKGPSAEQNIEAELAMFTTLAHEIGHDKHNTATEPFKGGAAEDYVKYRSQIEAETVFNAFSIFNDLKGHHEFKPRWNNIGYGRGSGLESAAIAREWNEGKIDKDTTISRLAAPIPEFPYTRPEPLIDVDGDRKLTQRDAYLRDYEHVIKQHPELAKPAELPQESIPAKSPRVRGTGNGRAIQEGDGPDVSPRTPDGDVAVVNRVDPLLEAIWAQLPKGTSREKAEEVKLAAKIGGIERQEQFVRIDYKDNDAQAYVRGNIPGSRAIVDLSTPAPSLQATQQREQTHDQEQALMWERFAQQREQINRDAPKLTPPGGPGRGPGSSPNGGSADS